MSWHTYKEAASVSGEAAMVMGALISCIKRRKQKDIHSKSNDAITTCVCGVNSILGVNFSENVEINW